jgi:uncharacterized protein YkwD
MKALTLTLVAVVATMVIGITATGTTQAATTPSYGEDAVGTSALSPSVWSDWEKQVLSLHNQARAKAGKAALGGTDSLGQAAAKRCTEITQKFSHTRPSGKSWYTVFAEFGISYHYAGENIAWGQSSPTAVHNAWMNSSGHKANILNAKFTKAGVGHCTKGTANYWVVLFRG